ncbi:MAG: ATP-binding cassette domain-containing protein [Myxococcota bacterium]
MSTPQIQLKGLEIRTSERVLVSDVHVSVHEGEILALVGASGSGKSLSARAMMGVLDVSPGLSAGELYWGARPGVNLFANVVGRGVAAQRRLARETAPLRGHWVSYAPQAAASALNPGRTIGMQLEMAIRRRDALPSSIPEEIRTLLDEVGLPPRVSNVLPGSLSGGMAQRAAVAVALAPAPSVLIADEPETGLDPLLRKRMVLLLVEVARRRNAALVLISHHRDTVDRVADTVVSLGGGHD